jgi:hypothetical protein
MANKTIRRNWLILASVIFLTTFTTFILIYLNIIDLQKIKDLGDDFQYNAISMSSVIGGFLFTGISILISIIDKDRIKRLWENNYLDNLYRSAFTGMISNLITIFLSFCFLCCNINEKVYNILLSTEITSLIVGLVCFAWCIKRLIILISKLKPTK